MVQAPSHREQLLTIKQVVEITSFTRPTIYTLMRISDFPRPIKTGLRAVRWKRSDIDHWIETRPTA